MLLKMGLFSCASIMMLTALAVPRQARACGCFAGTTVTNPVVQAGEQIVFAHEEGVIIAHIQIQYAGDAEDFVWLLPLPAEPDISIGTEELFARLQETTGPRFILNRTPGDDCPSSGGFSIGCSDDAAVFDEAFPKEPASHVLVKESTAGPYETVVVRADEKAPMLEWLQSNGYFVPAGTQAAIDPYIRPGGLFLVLKLRSGQTVGDLQPIVVKYPSALPMIPIILTSVAANPDMGIQVWVLGNSRAIPHNYQHVLINEAFIDWQNGAANYAEIVGNSVDESEEHHAFVTEFAGPTTVMQNVLAGNDRFGSQESLASIANPSQYVEELKLRRFWSPGLRPILQRELNIPSSAFENLPSDLSSEILELQYFAIFESFASTSTSGFDGVALTNEIWEKIVKPSEASNQLFSDHRYLTRMFSTLDPDEMTEDPVFAFNPDLPSVSNQHIANLTNHCNDKPDELELADGRFYRAKENGKFDIPRPGIPSAVQIEILRQEGAPVIVVDNHALLAEADDHDDGGCIDTGRLRYRSYAWLLYLGLIVIGHHTLRRRRA